MTRSRLMAITLIPIALILAAILAVSLVTGKKRALSIAEREMTERVLILAERFDGELRRAAQVADLTASRIATRSDLTEPEIYSALGEGILEDPLIFGAGMAFVPGGFDQRDAFCPYVYRTSLTGSDLAQLDIADAYDYFNDPDIGWWHDPVNAGRPVWSEPYFDEGAGNIMMATYSVPFYDDGRLRGVTTIDIPLEPLEAFLGTDLDTLVITGEGRFIHRAGGVLEGNPTIFDHAADRADVLGIARRMVAGESGMGELHTAGERQLAFFAPLPSAGWSFAVYLPEKQALADARHAARWMAAAMLLALALIALALWRVAGLVLRTQAEARAGEARTRALIESAPDAMVIVDKTGTIVMVNDQAEKTFGYPAAAMTGKSVDMLVPPAVRGHHPGLVDSFFANPVRREMLGGNSLMAAHADGRLFPIEVGLSPLETAEGMLVSSVIRDITERRKAEDELAQQRILLASTIEAIPDIIFVKDSDGRYLQCNPACARFMGRDPADIIGATDEDLLGAEIAQEFRLRDQQVVDAGKRVTNEEWVTYPDGSERLLETTKVPFKDCTGQLGGVLGVSRDITERHLAAEKLAEAEERHRLVLESTGEGIFGVDAAGKVMFINRAAAQLLGFSKDELLGKGIHDIIHHSRIDGTPYPVEECPMHAAFADGVNSKVDDEVLWRKDGSYFDVEYSSTPLRKDGKLVGAVIVFRDITERKIAEIELLQARDAAQAANRAKSGFLANMSHELRTPMNAIIGYSEMLIEEAEDLEMEAFIADLKKIHGAGGHLLSLINDILDLSKIEAGKMELYLENFPVDKMLADIASTVQTLVAKKHNQLEVVGAEDAGSMRSDLTKVRQTLFNLISNAAKFTENGTITLSVERGTDTETGDWLEFAVADTGIGIAEDKIEDLFKEFTQADASTTREYGGTGLGLAITRRFCTMLGGTIGCTSKPGEGTTFTMRLPAETVDPRQEEEAAADAARSESQPAISATTATTATTAVGTPKLSGVARGKVLVIDDDATVRELLARDLTRDGYEVLLAENGAQGLELARSEHPAAITLDVMMPGMDGWSVLRALKADEATAAIPVIMITIVDDKSLGYTLGAAEYLSKPVDRKRLREAMSRLQTSVDGDVLVVDDEPDVRELTRRTLEAEGLGVREAGNGQEALEEVARKRPGLIILDLMMPVMDGFEFVLRLRQNPDTADLPVVVVTAKELTAEDRERLHGKVHQVMQKGGFRREDLVNEVRRTVDRAVKRDEAGSA
ncbi:MAG: PAS domain S-box protein [Gammaproteobacteria bacterium]